MYREDALVRPTLRDTSETEDQTDRCAAPAPLSKVSADAEDTSQCWGGASAPLRHWCFPAPVRVALADGTNVRLGVLACSLTARLGGGVAATLEVILFSHKSSG